MLQLKKIVKNYLVGDTVIEALRGIDLSFRDSEFVSILGPSGCGKTTMLNIIGGLDRYTSGDLIISGRSTKEYKDRDWDNYRNHSIGFVFQNYNLIPHQTVLSNVELALTLSGVSKSERRKRAKEALEKVGLGNQLNKKPNQMSGGQMQRVAIARALVNDPEILLADEPTGALDSQTSEQVMDILKSISDDRLIIMVTHNAELAQQYSTRIVTLKDGEVTGDSDPFDAEKEKTEAVEKTKNETKTKGKKEKTSMSFFTALALSFNNLMTKRARTFLTAFAGSIGIIGIALILAMSTGVNEYINTVQRDTLSSYPLTIEAEQADLSSILSALGNNRGGSDNSADTDTEKEEGIIYSNPRLYEMFNALVNVETNQNDLKSFKKYLDEQMDQEKSTTEAYKYISSIEYLYPVNMNTYVRNEDGKYINTNLNEIFTSDYGMEASEATGSMSNMSDKFGSISSMSSGMGGMSLWDQILPGKDGALVSDIVMDQYDLVWGKWPEEATDIVLIIDEHNKISDTAFYALGMIPESDITDIFKAVMTGNEIDIKTKKLKYDDLKDISIRMLTDSEMYNDNDGDGIWENISADDDLLQIRLKNALELHICGVIRPTDDVTATTLNGTFGYTTALTDYVIRKNDDSEIIKAQQKPENENVDILTGLPFVRDDEDLDEKGRAEKVREYLSGMTDAEKYDKYLEILSVPDAEELKKNVELYMQAYDTREKMVEMISSRYGMTAEEADEYLSSYTDNELRDMISSAVEEVIKAQYQTAAEEKLEEMMFTPSEDELAQIRMSILANLPDYQTKLGYVAQAWAANGADMMTVMGYLMTLQPAQVEELVNTTVNAQAADLYKQYADPNSGMAKVIAVFDEEYTNSDDDAKLAGIYELVASAGISGSSLEKNLKKLGMVDLDSPSVINIYASTFENKDTISTFISDYNNSVDDEKKIDYTDYIALLMSGITGIINAISIGLMIFVSVSLVVSSIMIGIITYISVLERTKEIGILRSIGASKHNISSVFNAETMIIGLLSGIMGVGISLLLCIPISLIVHALTGIGTINAFIYPVHCLLLALLSMCLTMIGGFIPAKMAANKDPVIALRSGD